MEGLEIPKDLVLKIAKQGSDPTQSDPWILFLKPAIAECMKKKLGVTSTEKFGDSESFTLPSG
jgi:hypothetical protein